MSGTDLDNLEERCVRRRIAMLDNDPLMDGASPEEQCEYYCIAYMLGVQDAKDIRRQQNAEPKP